MTKEISNGARVAVVIPAYNESKHIRKVLNGFKDYDYEVIVVDDGSSDNTKNIVEGFPEIKLVEHMINRGMGAALQTGNELALKRGADIIVHFDADGQMLTREIHEMIEPLRRKEADITLGSRFLKKKSNIPLLKKYFILKPGRVINWLFTGAWLTDANNGWRAFTKDAAKKININQDRMAHNTEIVQAIKKYNLQYKEIPVTIIYNEFGQGIMGGLKIIRDLIIKKF